MVGDRYLRVAIVSTERHTFSVLAQDIVYRCNGKLIVEQAGHYIGDEEDEAMERKYRLLFGWNRWELYQEDTNGVNDLIDSDEDEEDALFGGLYEEPTLELVFLGDLQDFIYR